MSKIGLVGGSGVEELLFTAGFKVKSIKTKYGVIKVKIGLIDSKTIVFLNRHGENYTPPSLVNYRGNIAALKSEGVKVILATAAVGSLDLKIKPGDFILLSDFLDFTKRRTEYFDPKAFPDVSFPYHEKLRRQIQKAASKLGIKIHPQATYVCTEGPRFETKAEIKAFQKLGSQVVGMTQVPEVVLASEAKIPYAAIAVATNFAAGISKEKISSQEVISMMKKKNRVLSQLLIETIKTLD